MNELIDKYFENTLSTHERESFERLLKTDQNFRETFEFEQDLRQALHAKERKNLKSFLNEIEHKSQKKARPFSFSFGLKFAAAAAIIFLVGFGIIQFLKNGAENKQLYTAYYQTFPNVVAPTVRGNSKEDVSSEAFAAYDAGDFEKARQLFKEIEGEEYARFYEALSLLETGETEQAIYLLRDYEFSNVPYPFKTYSKWYLAMAYLKMEDNKAAKTILEKIAQSNHPQAHKAREILVEL